MGYSAKPIEFTKEEVKLAHEIIFSFGPFMRSGLAETIAMKVKGPRSGLMPHLHGYFSPCEKLINELVREGSLKKVSSRANQVYSGSSGFTSKEVPAFTMTLMGRAKFLKRKNDDRFGSINRA